MARNIVICSDGTGNTFDKSVSNVTRLIQLLALDKSKEQVVIYDQGIGTNARRRDAIEEYRKSIPDKDALKTLPGPKGWWFDPTGWPSRVLGLVGGYGFKANVGEMYQKLSQLYEGPEDKVYLFGFSRGAFTVRALAGLIYRCGLPGADVANNEKKFKVCFGEAYNLFKPIYRTPIIRKEIEEKVRTFRKDYAPVRDCKIHFLGIWDTVKSYGGVWPILLPHLRHNPHVEIVRHAVALDERRSWFNATTWGRLILDEEGAARRLTETERAEIKKQDIEEVWFQGCHSDIGGGDEEEFTARIALRWMIGEAADKDVRLNECGEMMLKHDNSPKPVKIHESLWGPWWLAEYFPRWEITNLGEYPKRKFKCFRTGQRHPDDLIRRDNLTGTEEILLHTSVGTRHSISGPVKYRPTKLLKHSGEHVDKPPSKK